MVKKEDLTLGGGHTMRYTDDVLQNYTLEIYIILLTSHTNKFNKKSNFLRKSIDNYIKIQIRGKTEFQIMIPLYLAFIYF